MHMAHMQSFSLNLSLTTAQYTHSASKHLKEQRQAAFLALAFPITLRHTSVVF